MPEQFDTQTVRQSPTSTGAVARYVGLPIGIKHVPVLTHTNQGIAPERGRAEHQGRAELLRQPREWVDQAEKYARPTDQAEQTVRDRGILYPKSN